MIILAIFVYLCIGYVIYSQFHWCLGTSSNSRSAEDFFIHLSLLVGWPVWVIGFVFVVLAKIN